MKQKKQRIYMKNKLKKRTKETHLELQENNNIENKKARNNNNNRKVNNFNLKGNAVELEENCYDANIFLEEILNNIIQITTIINENQQ